MRDQRMKELFKQIQSVEEELKAARESVSAEQSAKDKAEKKVAHLEGKCKQLKQIRDA
jgi:phage shock protein A